MTTKELFEKFIEEARVCESWTQDGAKMQERIKLYQKEIEASIRKEVVEEIQEGVRNYKVEKELKSNTLGADYIFVYDLNTFVLNKLTTN